MCISFPPTLHDAFMHHPMQVLDAPAPSRQTANRRCPARSLHGPPT